MALSKPEQRTRTYLVLLAFILFSVFIVGLFWLATTPETGVSVALSYAAGLSMIILPCTFPLVFIIVPLSMGKGYKKGLGMALLFSLGLIITISLYGVSVAFIGKFVGLDLATRVMFSIAGLAAFAFGLSELRLVRFHVPGLNIPTPMFIMQRKDYSKAFFLGLFLGNAGIGCPNPAFYVLLTYIASIGSIVTGGLLGFVHALGRATPLIFIAILSILGVNATKGLVKRQEKIMKATGLGLIFIGGFLLVFGVYGMHWWEDSVFHAGWNQAVMDIAPALAEQPDHPVAEGLIDAPLEVGWITFLALIFLPILYYYRKNNLDKRQLVIIGIIFLLFAVAAASGLITAVEPHGHIG